MTTHLHVLKGCAPTPLANYLKALGILRLVGEQADPQARGWWEGERFCLLTTLSKEELERFFLEDYAPTPLVAPSSKRTIVKPFSPFGTLPRSGLKPFVRGFFRRNRPWVNSRLNQRKSRNSRFNASRFLNGEVNTANGSTRRLC